MTPTAIELWNDKRFIQKRKNEQIIYLFELQKRIWGHHISEERYELLLPSAESQLKKFENRLKELNSALV